MRPDIQAAVDRMTTKFRVKRELSMLPDMLQPGETVNHIGHGNYDDKNAIIVATNQRVIFLAAGLLSVKDEAFTIPQISSIEMKKKLVLANITVTVSNQSAEIKNMDPATARTIVDAVRAAAAPKTDAASQLLKIKQLHDAGILSDDEYEQKRAELIDQL